MPLNLPQQLFLDQARSDFEIFTLLARRDPCHRLHYLQMSTEKLSKAWFWRLMCPPAGGHQTFVPFLRALDSSGRADIHRMFGYTNVRRFEMQRPAIFSLAMQIQNLAPGPANPNPEYPWPRHQPTAGPLSHKFSEWYAWNNTTAGRHLRFFMTNMLTRYLEYFPK